MGRRSVLRGLFGMPLVVMMAGTVFAQGDPLADAFALLSETERAAVQRELATAGYYNGMVDARFGNGTRAGLVEAAAFIADNSSGREAPEVTTAAGAQDYLGRLASGELAAWLYGEGGEADY